MHIIQIMETNTFKKILTKTMKKYVKHYTMLSLFCKSVENFLTPILFFKIQCVVAVNIFATFEIVTVRQDDYDQTFSLSIFL